jgi:hypothetical protein
MSLFVGVTPRSRRAAIRRERARYVKRLEVITGNMSEYVWTRDQARLNRHSETVVDQQLAKIDRETRAINAAMERLRVAPDKLEAELAKNIAGESAEDTEDDGEDDAGDSVSSTGDDLGFDQMPNVINLSRPR